MTWIETEIEQPNRNEWVLVWSHSRGFPGVSKWTGTHWKSGLNTTKKSDGTHWARVVGPDGQSSVQAKSTYPYTKKESQDNR